MWQSKKAQAELKKTTKYLQRNHMRLICGKMDDSFTEYTFLYIVYEEQRRYLHIRLRNRTEELVNLLAINY